MARFEQVAGSVAFGAAGVFSLLIAAASYRFVPSGVAEAMDHIAHNLEGNSLALYAHIAVAPVALALMPFQFMSGLRARRPSLHRWMGRGYVAAIAVSGLAGIQLAFHSQAGAFAATGFALLGVWWLIATGAALVFALKGAFARHRDWMLRSAALTFAAVTLRLYLGAAMAADLDFAIAYPVIAWICWVPNALAVEIWLRRERRGRSATVPAAF